MASRRAAVTSPSFCSSACWRMGGSVFSGSASALSSPLSFLSPVLSPALFTAANAGATRASGSVSARAPASRRAASERRLFVVLVFIRPVLAFERPVLFVIAHQSFKLERGEQLGRIAAVAQLLDLDLQLLLLADDGVDLGEAGLA